MHLYLRIGCTLYDLFILWAWVLFRWSKNIHITTTQRYSEKHQIIHVFDYVSIWHRKSLFNKTKMNLVSTVDENIKKQHPAKSHEQYSFYVCFQFDYYYSIFNYFLTIRRSFNRKSINLRSLFICLYSLMNDLLA